MFALIVLLSPICRPMLQAVLPDIYLSFQFPFCQTVHFICNKTVSGKWISDQMRKRRVFSHYVLILNSHQLDSCSD